MRSEQALSGVVALMLILACTASAQAQLTKGAPAPPVKAVDLAGNPVDLDKMVAGPEKPYLVILCFFTTDTGEAIAQKLQLLHSKYGEKKIRIAAFGVREDAAELRDFAGRFGIQYHLVDAGELAEAGWLEEVKNLPLTVFVEADEKRTIERVLTGGGTARAMLLKEVAENLFQQRRDEALAVAEEAVEADEAEASTRELKGFILLSQGKIDEAQAEFGAIDSKTGLAGVALENGDYDKASALADEAPDPYAATIKAEALLHQGKLEDAQAVLEAAPDKEDAPAWQRAETANTEGRLKQQQNRPDEALNAYGRALSLDHYNVVALSNEASVHREQGNLDQAQSALEEASVIREDPFVRSMLQQVQRELEEANDLKRAELVRQQIQDLAERYKEMQESGALEEADDWTTRPLILAFLPSATADSVFFERGGTKTLIQREIEARLQQDSQVSVVERQMLDKLLQELQLGSSELARSDTQQRLGKVLSAGVLGFIDFARAGADAMVYLRLVDTETTGIVGQVSQKIDERDPAAVAQTVAGKVVETVTSERELRGLIADASSEDAVIINLGGNHGVGMGQRFAVLEEGDPIEVGGRVIAYRQRQIALLEVTALEDEYAICKVVQKRDDATLQKEMKIKAAN